MAITNPQIKAVIVESNEFPDLTERYQVYGVPKTIVNGTVEILGAQPEPVFVKEALAALESEAGG